MFHQHCGPAIQSLADACLLKAAESTQNPVERCFAFKYRMQRKKNSRKLLQLDAWHLKLREKKGKRKILQQRAWHL